jgi:AGZA family xanthine/uracil permease-like MFS transporter
MGTTLAVGGKAGLLDADGNMPDINKPFIVDSIAATLGPLLGVPALTALIESAAGAEAGGRTGLTALAAAVLFAATLLLVPLALMIPAQATAPALIIIGLAMFSGIRKVDLENFTDGLPAILMVLMTVLSNSFGTGIAGGLLSYVLIKLLAGKAREVSLGMYVLAVPLAYYFWTVVGR